MAKVVAVHSFRGGTGKSSITASLAALVAAAGHRVGVVDTDIQSPGIHVLFGLGEEQIGHTLNDHLWGRCAIQDAAYEVDGAGGGALYLIPSSLKIGEIARVLREGYDVDVLNDSFRQVVDALALEYLFIDTHPGLNEETLVSISISDVLVIIMRPDEQDYLGTAVTLDVARRLFVPRLGLVVNKVLAPFDEAQVRAEVGAAYGCEVLGVLPHADDMMRLSSRGVFAVRHPDHGLTATLRGVAAAIAVDA